MAAPLLGTFRRPCADIFSALVSGDRGPLQNALEAFVAITENLSSWFRFFFSFSYGIAWGTELFTHNWPASIYIFVLTLPASCAWFQLELSSFSGPSIWYGNELRRWFVTMEVQIEDLQKGGFARYCKNTVRAQMWKFSNLVISWLEIAQSPFCHFHPLIVITLLAIAI